MFKMFEDEDINKFSWDYVGDIVDGRRHIGDSMPVFIYRLFQYTIKNKLSDSFGKEETSIVFRSAGEAAGKEFANKLLDLSLPFNDFLAHFKKVFEDSKIGILRIEKFDINTGFAVITIGEDLDCSGLPVTGEHVCNYDEGFLAAILKVYTKKEYIVTEVDCWASGARVCRFEASRKDVGND